MDGASTFAVTPWRRSFVTMPLQMPTHCSSSSQASLYSALAVPQISRLSRLNTTRPTLLELELNESRAAQLVAPE
eukprot:CAMPEP_0170642860 /NCGR_PEP_ID=MMETSP0224-20130122/41558_1 /TAXON_ID=285029 /ORGANISM="Togula jolla, Strain CCCM 725" /LENGTH=74 /DNA_ID=CAMNT_0010973611 /DNA_START=323 /DNA_END=544 /DNA_ORIENTATION=+